MKNDDQRSTIILFGVFYVQQKPMGGKTRCEVVENDTMRTTLCMQNRWNVQLEWTLNIIYIYINNISNILKDMLFF